jgi:hypothetical protein
LLTVTNLVNGDVLQLSGAAALASGAVGLEPLVGLTGLLLGNPNYTLAGATWSGAVQVKAAAGSGDSLGNIVAGALIAGGAAAAAPGSAGASDASTGAGNGDKAARALTQVPSTISGAFDPGAVLTLVSAPSAEEPTQVVSLSAVQAMRSDAASTGGSSTGSPGAGSDPAVSPDVRVPVSLNSLAEIVNGGVRLPSGVEQQLFVVAAH